MGNGARERATPLTALRRHTFQSPVARMLRRTAERIERRPPKDRRSLAHQIVGGMWHEMGRAQLDFLIGRGLQPDDALLDIGCGALRGGVHFVRYLDPGNYVGVDHQQWLLDVGEIELVEAGLANKGATLVLDGEFDFASIGRTFDVALAQSVFTHVPLNTVHRCLVRASEVLRHGGVLYATFLENVGDPHDLAPITFPQPDIEPTVTYPDKDPYHYPLRFFEALADGLPFELEHLGDFRTLRGQSMLAFHRV